MARTTADLLEQLMRWLPPGMAPYRPVLGGYAAAARAAEVAGEAAVDAATLGGAVAQWLDLHARGYGVERADGETDAQLVERLRNPEDMLTRSAILAAADRLLADYTDVAAVMIENWDGTHLDLDLYLDIACLVPQKAFALVVPLVGDPVTGASFADSDYADGETYAGSGVEHPVYAVLLREIHRLRAAGVSWWLVIDPRVAEGDKTFADSDYFDSSFAIP